MTSSIAESNVFREIERFTPIDYLAIGIMRVLGAEGRPANETLEHNGSNGPPVAAERIAFAGEDLRSNVVGCADCGIGHDTSRFAPGVDLAAVADSKIDLIKIDRVTIISWFGRRAFE